MLEFVVTMIQVKTFTDREKNQTREYYKVWFNLPAPQGQDPVAAWLYSNVKYPIGSKIKVGFRASNSKDNDGMCQLYIAQ